MANLSTESKEEKLSVGAALRSHRAWLLGVFLFPLAVNLAKMLGVLGCETSEMLLLPIALALVPLWDYTRCRAPYRLWIVAMGLWLLSLAFTQTGLG